MAKEGMKYFPLDCVLDEKFELIEAEFGLKGFAIIIKLLQKIYGGHGYYCEWDRDMSLLFARQNGLSSGGDDNCIQQDDGRGTGRKGAAKVDAVVAAAIRRGIFSREIFEAHGVLTSHEIQKNFVDAAERRKKISLEKRYLLLSDAELPKNVYISGENAYISEKNVYIFEQRKGKESKGYKKESVEKKAAPPPTPSLQEIRDYCRERGSSVDPDHFYDYYSSIHWRTGGNVPILDWKSRLRDWERKDRDKKAEEQQGQKENTAGNNRNNRFCQFEQHTYSKEDMDAIEKAMLENSWKTARRIM